MMVPVDKLEAGMEVAADVINYNQVLLMTKGTTLTQSYIRTLKMWGIEVVNVVSSEADSPPAPVASAFSDDLMNAAEQLVNKRFIHVLDNTVMAAILKKIAIERTARDLAAQPSPKQPTA